jgi:hypothetical protein
MPVVLLLCVPLADAGGFVEDDVEVLWEATGPGASFGWALADVADVNGDGARDVIISDPFALDKAGITMLLSGRDGSELFRSDGESGSAEGYAVSDAGDQNGDGVSDYLSGAVGTDTVVVYSGATGEVIDTIDGGYRGEYFGSAIARAGDVDGDGTDDLVFGAQYAWTGGTGSGRVALVSGRGGAPIWIVDGAKGDQLGAGAGTLGDVEVGAYGNGGAVLVLSGVDGTVLHRWTMEGAGSLGAFFVSGVGDLDGDGAPDVYAGDYASEATGKRAGRAYVWSGATGDLLLTIDGAPGDRLGPGRYAGDVDGDGTPDLAVGSYAQSSGAKDAGRVTLFSGVDGSVLRTITSTTAGEELGFDTIGIGDTNGDGGIDLLLSAATGNTVYLVAGIPPESPPAEAGPSGDDGDGCACGRGRAPRAAWLSAVVMVAAFARARRLAPLAA